MKKVALYCRVSSDDQKERETIENQIDILKTYIEMKEELEVYGEFLDDGISGTIPFENRPAGKRLLADGKEGKFDSILVYKVDRFGRDTLSGLSAVELLRKLDIEIISLTEPFDLNTPTGRFQFITYLNMAELDRNNILDRMFLGATRAAKQGKWVGGIVPFGYVVNKDKFLEINEDEAIIVRKIFDMYINEKMSTVDIAVYLNSMGVLCNYAARGTGKRNVNARSVWGSSSIQRILSNTTYMGIHEYGKRASRRKETIIRKVPAIIPIEVFENAIGIRKLNMKNSKRNSPNRDFLLRTLIKCGKCKRTYYGVYNSKCSDSYRCSGKRTENKKIYGIACDNINVNADIVENYVWGTCKELMLKFDDYLIVDDITNEEKDCTDKLNALNKQILNLDSEKSNILKLFRKNMISEDELEAQLSDIRKESEKIESIISSVNNNLNILRNKNDVIKNYKSKIEFYKNRTNSLTNVEKRYIIKLFVKEIIIDTKIENGIKYPGIRIVWYLSDLLFESSRLHILSRTYKEKNPSYYIAEKTGINRAHLVANLRLRNNVTMKSLSKILNISEVTLRSVEKGDNPSHFHYYFLYCRHFEVDSYIYLNYFSLPTKTFHEKIDALKAFYGLSSYREVCNLIGLHKDAISEVNFKRRDADKVIKLLDMKIEEFKKRYGN